MWNLIKMFLSGLYVEVRGRTVTSTVLTKNTMSYNHSFINNSGKPETVLLHCQQFEHITRPVKPWWPISRNFTYKVQVVLIRGDAGQQRLPIAYYPHMCAKWLAKTTYPHMCAINAYIDQIIHSNSATFEV